VGTGTAKQNQSNMAGTTTTGSAMFPAKLTNDATTQAITQVVQQIEAAPLPTPAENKPVAAPVVGLETPTRPQLSQAQRDKLDALGRQLDNLKARTAAVNNSLNTIQRQQGAGYGMRGDIAARQASMNLNLSKADEAFKAEDLDRASRFAAMTEADLRALETFLGQ
jgi:hypothetical protein